MRRRLAQLLAILGVVSLLPLAQPAPAPETRTKVTLRWSYGVCGYYFQLEGTEWNAILYTTKPPGCVPPTGQYTARGRIREEQLNALVERLEHRGVWTPPRTPRSPRSLAESALLFSSDWRRIIWPDLLKAGASGTAVLGGLKNSFAGQILLGLRDREAHGERALPLTLPPADWPLSPLPTS